MQSISTTTELGDQLATKDPSYSPFLLPECSSRSSLISSSTCSTLVRFAFLPRSLGIGEFQNSVSRAGLRKGREWQIRVSRTNSRIFRPTCGSGCAKKSPRLSYRSPLSGGRGRAGANPLSPSASSLLLVNFSDRLAFVALKAIHTPTLLSRNTLRSLVSWNACSAPRNAVGEARQGQGWATSTCWIFGCTLILAWLLLLTSWTHSADAPGELSSRGLPTVQAADAYPCTDRGR
jgi:hypothetical protein